MMERLSFDLHIHSKYSSDSLLSPERLLKRVASIGLNAIAITDHNTIKGCSIVKAIKPDSLFIVTGAEIATNYGDLTGLFLNQDIKSRIFEEVVDEIRDQDGLVVLPHPYRRKRFLPHRLLGMVDILEGINARSSEVDNKKAQKLSLNLRKPMIAASDAHTILEIGSAWTSIQCAQELDEDVLRREILNGQGQLVHSRSWPHRRITQPYSTCVRYLRNTIRII
jgi:predicted metal-dependent phosphoesterase TrpH